MRQVRERVDVLKEVRVVIMVCSIAVYETSMLDVLLTRSQRCFIDITQGILVASNLKSALLRAIKR